MPPEDFFSSYLSYTSNTEVPAFFSRWAAITGIGAFLGRQLYFEHGHFTIHPNMYTMLIGSPGTRKSTAIKLMKKLLINAGYDTIAADKTTKEKFLLDLAGESGDPKEIKSVQSILEENIFGDSDEGKQDAECFIMADEFNDFFGNGNIEFISLLGTLWDYSGNYKNRIKNGTSVSIHNPTVSILGGNTPTGFSLAFPTEILGQGFFSRILLIYGEPNGKRIAFPEPPDPKHTQDLVERLRRIKTDCYGAIEVTGTSRKLLEKIYSRPRALEDVRFESYSTRRFSHLLKLALVYSASSGRKTLLESDVIGANTILSYTEQLMPKALGEFGKAKNSDVSHKVIQLLDSATHVVAFKEIWRHVSSDLEKPADLATIMQNLQMADKIQQVKGADGAMGFLPKRRTIEQYDSSLLDYSILTEEERKIIL